MRIILRMATKKPVNLSLNKDNYEALREILSKMPGNPSVSSLVDEFIHDFVVEVGPRLETLVSASPKDRVQTLKGLRADLLSTEAVSFVDTMRTLEEKGGE